MPRAKLSVISTAALQAEIQKRMSGLAKLIAQRDDLDRQIAELQGTNAPVTEAPAAVAPAKTKGKKRGRKPGPKAVAVVAPAVAGKAKTTRKPLAEYVKEALTSGPQKIREIEKTVLVAGYPTKAANLYKPITKVLAQGGFKRIEKGVYALKSAAKAGVAAATAVVTKAVSKPTATPTPKGKRTKFAMPSEQFVLNLAQGKGATTKEINEAWKASGRGDKANKTLGKLVKAGKLKKTKLTQGSLYRLK